MIKLLNVAMPALVFAVAVVLPFENVPLLNLLVERMRERSDIAGGGRHPWGALAQAAADRAVRRSR